MNWFWDRLTLAVILVLASTLPSAAQSLSGPMLGFTRDDAGSVIWPIIGVPGAGVLAGRLQLDAEIQGAVIAPNQDYALASRKDDGAVVVIPLKNGPPSFAFIDSTLAGPDVIAISPTGSAAAIYNFAGGIIQVIARLPQAPALIGQFDVSAIEGRITGISLSDDGSVAFVNAADAAAGSTQLWVVTASASWSVASPVSALPAFFPHRNDAVIEDDSTQSVFLMMDVDRTAIRIPVLSAADGLNAFSSLSVSGDGRTILVADNTSGTVAIVDVATLRPALASCECRLTGLYRLKQDSIFRLTDASGEPVTVLDISSGQPRTFIVPPEHAGEGQ